MRTNHGFSLIEMAIVLVVLGVLSTVLIPPIVTSIRHEKRQENKDALVSLRHALVDTVRKTGKLPENLPGGFPKRDTWSRDYEYKPGFNASDDICDSGVTPEKGTLVIRLNATETIKPAFLIASRGHYVNEGDDVDYNASHIDLTDPKDDIIEYMSLNHLRYLVCGDEDDEESPGSAITGAKSVTVGHNSEVNGSVNSISGSVTLENSVHVNGDVNAWVNVTLISASFVTGSVHAGGDVQLNTGSKVGENIITPGNVDIGHTAVVEGDVTAGGDVTVGGEVKGNIYAHGIVNIGYNGKVLGNIISVGNITVEHTLFKPSVAGDLESKEDISLNWGSEVGGNVSAGGTVNKSSGASVGGTIAQGVPTTTPKEATQPELDALPDLQDFSSTGSDVTPNNGDILPPGNYGTVNVGYLSSIVLTGGEYVFKKLSLATSSTMKMNLDSDITILVEDDLSIPWDFRQLVSTNGVDYTPVATADHDIAKRIHVETKGRFELASQTKWMGTVLAQDKLAVGDNGLFIGRAVSRNTLELPSSVKYIYVPSTFSQKNW